MIVIIIYYFINHEKHTYTNGVSVIIEYLHILLDKDNVLLVSITMSMYTNNISKVSIIIIEPLK